MATLIAQKKPLMPNSHSNCEDIFVQSLVFTHRRRRRRLQARDYHWSERKKGFDVLSINSIVLYFWKMSLDFHINKHHQYRRERFMHGLR
jgi:hypothetical protein